jgi:hypothetical protein
MVFVYIKKNLKLTYTFKSLNNEHLQDVHDVSLHFDGRVGVFEGGLQPFVVERKAKARNAFLTFWVVDCLGRRLKCTARCSQQQ